MKFLDSYVWHFAGWEFWFSRYNTPKPFDFRRMGPGWRFKWRKTRIYVHPEPEIKNEPVWGGDDQW